MTGLPLLRVFSELILSDEVERRNHINLANRLRAAGFEEECTLERFDWSAKIRIDKARLTELFGLHFIERRENVIFCGPVGVGNPFWRRLSATLLAAPATKCCSAGLTGS